FGGYFGNRFFLRRQRDFDIGFHNLILPHPLLFAGVLSPSAHTDVELLFSIVSQFPAGIGGIFAKFYISLLLVFFRL
ncbi:MAG: hypothetical protein ACOY3H_00115, partial [Bacillota bacterium]